MKKTWHLCYLLCFIWSVWMWICFSVRVNEKPHCGIIVSKLLCDRVVTRSTNKTLKEGFVEDESKQTGGLWDRAKRMCCWDERSSFSGTTAPPSKTTQRPVSFRDNPRIAAWVDPSYRSGHKDMLCLWLRIYLREKTTSSSGIFFSIKWQLNLNQNNQSARCLSRHVQAGRQTHQWTGGPVTAPCAEQGKNDTLFHTCTLTPHHHTTTPLLQKDHRGQTWCWSRQKKKLCLSTKALVSVGEFQNEN